MKKSTLLFVTLISFATMLQAQTNVAKLNLAGLIVGQIDLQYERVIKPRQTAHLTIGIMPGSNQAPDLQSRINAAVPNSNVKVSSAILSGFQFCPEYRFYTGEKELQGFYVGPQVCYSGYTLEAKGSHYVGSPYATNDNATVKYSALGIGAHIGMHWIVKDRISIDWQILGTGISFAGANMTGTTNLDSEEGVAYWTNQANSYMQKDERLNLVKFIPLKSSGKTITGVGNTVLPYFRMGLAVGYVF
jgi:Protein of unknown function (DUF3575)